MSTVFLVLTVGACGYTPEQSRAAEQGAANMPSQIDCTDNAVARSRCMIETILKDLSETYKPIGGGGISMIRQDATNVYTVSISQEERVDLITYTVTVTAEGHVTIVDRKTDTMSPGR